jgi:hypothetical protein
MPFPCCSAMMVRCAWYMGGRIQMHESGPSAERAGIETICLLTMTRDLGGRA